MRSNPIRLFAAPIVAGALILLAAPSAFATISGVSSSTTGATCSGGGSTDGDCRNSTSVPVNNGTTLQSRYAWNINADTGVGSTHDTSSNAVHNITFTATAPGSYQLTIATRRLGDVNVVNDISGCNGSGSTGGITGSSNVTLASGTLTGADPADVGNTSSTTDAPFDISTAAVIGPRLSNGAGQSHTLTFTWSGSVRSNSCEAAVRQGENSGTTTGCSACGYPGNFSRTQANDGHFVTITFQSFCGDGSINGTGEQCDQGAANGTTGSCCTSTCQLKGAGTVCRTGSGDACDPDEACTGSSPTCPADVVQSTSFTCRGAAGECDLAETCTGVPGQTCPGDAKKSNGTACTDDGNVCTTDTCNGSSNTCQHAPGHAGTVCRVGSGDVCDPQQTCTGSSATCPSALKANTFTCRNAAGECDQAENCTGVAGQTCPADGKKSNGTACTDDGNPCSTDSCDGSSNLCQHPAGNAGAVCRPVAGACDVAETCTGSSTSCPADGFASSSTVCRPAVDECDLADNCPGSGPSCTADAKKSAGTSCSSDGNPCTVDQCDGSADACQHPAGNAGAECRPAAGVCDLAESCDGSSSTCPSDAKSTAECRPSAGVCDDAESCDGSSDDCPADTFEPSTTLCRASAGACDPAENCTGTSADCPADAKSTDVCRPSIGPCDVTDSCDGVSNDCPADAVQPGGTECRASAGDCDVAESCDGSSPVCPGDAVKPSSVECRASAGPCDIAENCTGTSATCPPDGFTSAGGAFICRPAAGPCDLPDICDGSGSACPADQKSTAVCRPAAGPCDVADSCDGVSDACPADQKSTAVCRPAAGPCDVAESCDGASNACPTDGFVSDGTSCDDGNSCTEPDACQSGVCTGTPNAGGCVDHYLCYKTKEAVKFTTIPNVNLVDTFQPNANFDLVKVVHLCNPANKNNEGILDPITHERSYRLKAVAHSPRFVKVTGIHTVNQLGTLTVDAVKPDILLVPAAESIISSPPALGPNNVDHYKCYKTATTRNTPKFPKGVTVTVADQFRTTPATFDVKKPRHFCTPVQKNGEPVHNPNGYMLCYLAKPSRGQPKHQKLSPVYVRDQFGPFTVSTITEDELCIPTIRTP